MPSYVSFDKDRNPMFWKGDLGDHCTDCAGFGDYLCDFPVGNGKTCDRIVCEDHCKEIAPEIHYCNEHHKEWKEFKESGGVKRELENIIAFKHEK